MLEYQELPVVSAESKLPGVEKAIHRWGGGGISSAYQMSNTWNPCYGSELTAWIRIFKGFMDMCRSRERKNYREYEEKAWLKERKEKEKKRNHPWSLKDEEKKKKKKGFTRTWGRRFHLTWDILEFDDKFYWGLRRVWLDLLYPYT